MVGAVGGLPPGLVQGGEAQADDAGWVSPPGAPDSGELRVLYVFAGRARDGDLGFWLQALAGGCLLRLVEVDVVRRPADDLMKPALRERLVNEVRAGGFDVVVASPPC